jgi:hypothetical protein
MIILIGIVRDRLIFCEGKALCHEDVWATRGVATPFFTSTLDESEWSASRLNVPAGNRTPAAQHHSPLL